MADSKWYKEDKDDCHEQLFRVIQKLDREQDYRNEDDLRNLRLYGNLEIEGLGIDMYAKSRSSASVMDRLSLNVIQNMCDTVTNKIAKNKPRVSFLTTGGTGKQQKKAKQLTKFIDGMLYQQNFHEKAQRAFKDAAIFGTGIVKFLIRDNEPVTERIFPNEIMVDDVQSIHGEPRELHQRKYVNKEVLASLYPEYSEKIMSATSSGINFKPISKAGDDQVFVCETWRLPSKKGAKDGRHVICIQNCTILDEEWTKSYFPFLFIRWNERPVGFYGQGLSEQLTGIQIEINKLLRTIQLSMNLMGVPRVWVDEQSKVISSHIDNKIGNIMKFRGTKPSFEVVNSIHPDVLNQVSTLYQRAYEIGGVSQLSAQSKKPAGIESAVAMREFNDIESERFVLVGQRYEKFYVDSAHMFIDIAKEIYKEDKKFSVKLKGKRFVEQINWADIDVKEDDYIIKPFATNGLGNSPADRQQKVAEMVNAGFMNKEQAMEAMDMPDLESFFSIELASIKNIQMTIEKIVEDGIDGYRQPEPYQNLAYGIRRFQVEYLQGVDYGLEEDRLELLRTWIEAAKGMLDRASQMAQAQQMAQAKEMEAGQAPDPNAQPVQ